MLRLVVTNRVDGRTVLDTVGVENLVQAIAEKYSAMSHYRVSVTYP